LGGQLESIFECDFLAGNIFVPINSPLIVEAVAENYGGDIDLNASIFLFHR
jgi:hypothetical protein